MSEVNDAIALLFEGFKARPRPSTRWVEHLLQQEHMTDTLVERSILVAIATYCPNLPDDRIPILVAILKMAVRAAERDERR